MGKEFIKAPRFSPYNPKTFDFDKCNHVNLVLHNALIPRDYRAHVFASEKELLYHRYMICNAVNVTQSVDQARTMQRIL